MQTIEAKRIQATIDFIESKIDAMRNEAVEHIENPVPRANLAGWYEGRADAFQDVARWFKKDLEIWAKETEVQS